MLQKRYYNFHSNCLNTCWTLRIRSLSFGALNNTAKRGQNLLSSWKQQFFERKLFSDICHPESFLYWKFCLLLQKNVFSTTSQVLKNLSYYFHSKCQKTLSTLINCSLRFFILDNTRKIGQTIFFTGKSAFFSKICFQQPLRCYRNDIITSTVAVPIHVGPLEIVPWVLAHSKKTGKKAKIFCRREDSLFKKIWFSTS